MFSSKIPNSLGINFDPFVPVTKPTLVLLTLLNSTVMWRNIARKVSPRFSSLKALPSLSTCGFPGLSDSIIPEKLNKLRQYDLSSCPINGSPELGFSRMAEILPRDEFLGRPNCNFNGLCPKSYASVAETIAVSSTDGEEDVSSEDEVQELLQEMGKEAKRGYWKRRRQQSVDGGMGRWKYHKLRRRQVKIETELWEQAVKEYRNLLKEMCEQKLAPNLPYMKSLFLGWFEPFTNKINEDQELCRQGKSRASYAPYFDQLPADMMSVITMHKLLGLLMTGEGYGSARVVQAACAIGGAIEQEARNLLPHKCTPCTTTEEKRQTFQTASRTHQMLLKGSGAIISESKGQGLKLSYLGSVLSFEFYGELA